jgi:hypothetical protein
MFPHVLFWIFSSSGALQAWPAGLAHPQAVHVALPALGVWCPTYGLGEGNVPGQLGSCAGTPSKSAAKPLQPNGTLGTHVVTGLQSSSSQSVFPSASSSEPFKQFSPPGFPPTPVELLDVAGPPPVPPGPAPPMPAPVDAAVVDPGVPVLTLVLPEGPLPPPPPVASGPSNVYSSGKRHAEGIAAIPTAARPIPHAMRAHRRHRSAIRTSSGGKRRDGRRPRPDRQGRP